MITEELGIADAGDGLLHLGSPIERASGAMILMHGRGVWLSSVEALAEKFMHQGIALFVPLAQCGSWYPHKYYAPIEQNEPAFSSGIKQIDTLIKAIHGKGIAYEKMVVAGFSQGACMALEYAIRHPRPYAGVIGYSGGLLGPQLLSIEDHDHLCAAPVFVGVGDCDTQIKVERIVETCERFKTLGANVEMRIYPNMGHTLNDDEISYAKKLLSDLTESSGSS